MTTKTYKKYKATDTYIYIYVSSKYICMYMFIILNAKDKGF